MTDEEFWDSFPDNFRWPEEHPLDRFYSRVNITDGCWEWTGGRLETGYGVFTIGHWTQRTSLLAHRFMLTLVNGKVHNIDVHHKCKNKSCVNPEHLEDLSRRDHMQVEPRGGDGVVHFGYGQCCTDTHYANGLCKRHYERIYRLVRAGRACWLKVQQQCAA